VSHPGELQTKWFQGLLPLSFAVSAWRPTDTEDQKIAVCRLLIELGANVNVVNELGATPLDDATMAGKSSLAAFLRGQGGTAKINPLGLSNVDIAGLAEARIKALPLAPEIRDKMLEVKPARGFKASRALVVAGLAWLLGLGLIGFAVQFLRPPAPVPTRALSPAEMQMSDAEDAFRQQRHSQVLDLATRALPQLTDERTRMRARKMIVESALATGDYQTAKRELDALLKSEPKNPKYKEWSAKLEAGKASAREKP
jgi:hypothetical protein